MSAGAPRHVLMTADSVGGVWTYALELCRELGRVGTEVTLVVMGRKPDREQTREVSSLGNVALIGTDLRLEWMEAPEADLRLADELLIELEAERQPDIVHLNSYAHATLPFSAPILVVAHSCVSTWWRACRGAPAPANWARYQQRIAEAVASADLLVAPTAAYLESFVALHGEPQASRVIWNGRDPALFDASAPKQPLALASGRLWDEAKNLSLLCAAAEGLGFPVQIAGSAGAALTNVPENLANLGFLSGRDLRARMAQAAVYVAPARYEPFGLGILEAAFSGAALVLGDIPTLRELWDGAALFISPDDAPGLRATLARLLADPQACHELGAKARARAAQYGARRMGEAYCEAYRMLLAGVGQKMHGATRAQGLRTIAAGRAA